MKGKIIVALGLLAAISCVLFAAPPPPAGGGPEPVATFPQMQATGVAVSRGGRLFVNFPNWSEGHTISVAEVVQGKPQPYPDARWNKPGDPKNTFVCVQSVFIDEEDALWILDPAAPRMGGIVPGGPKLLKVNLASNRVERVYPFGEDAAPRGSYLNDVRIDPSRGVAYLTDSGLGALVVLDLKSGRARRLLADHPSTKANPTFHLVVGGRPLVESKTGLPPQIHADGIALEPTRRYLYYHALTAHPLYRIKTDDLLDETLTPTELGAKVEKMIDTPAPDGMLAGKDGSIYLTDIENNAIRRYDPKANRISTVVESPSLNWPDSLSWMPDGSLAVTISQIDKMPRFNAGKSRRRLPYRVYKVRVP